MKNLFTFTSYLPEFDRSINFTNSFHKIILKIYKIIKTTGIEDQLKYKHFYKLHEKIDNILLQKIL